MYIYKITYIHKIPFFFFILMKKKQPRNPIKIAPRPTLGSRPIQVLKLYNISSKTVFTKILDALGCLLNTRLWFVWLQHFVFLSGICLTDWPWGKKIMSALSDFSHRPHSWLTVLPLCFIISHLPIPPHPPPRSPHIHVRATPRARAAVHSHTGSAQRPPHLC